MFIIYSQFIILLEKNNQITIKKIKTILFILMLFKYESL